MKVRPVTGKLTVRSGDAVFGFDRDLTVRSWNRQAELLTGRPADSVIGRPCWEAMGAVDEDGALVCHSGCSCARLAREGWPVPRKTLLVKAKNGNRRPFTVSCRLLGTPNRSPAGACGADSAQPHPGDSGRAARPFATRCRRSRTQARARRLSVADGSSSRDAPGPC